jgi:hypothetical protein
MPAGASGYWLRNDRDSPLAGAVTVSLNPRASLQLRKTDCLPGPVDWGEGAATVCWLLGSTGMVAEPVYEVPSTVN